MDSFRNILSLLSVFESISGFIINRSKCSLLGIHLNDVTLQDTASLAGCEVHLLPTSHLGLSLGHNPRLRSFWSPVLEKSFWSPVLGKVDKRLDVGRGPISHLVLGTRFFSRVSQTLPFTTSPYSMRCFLWSRVGWVMVREITGGGAETKGRRGLGLGNLTFKNFYLLGKWLWGYHLEPESLWHKVIQNIHGHKHDRWDALAHTSCSLSFPWKAISCISSLSSLSLLSR